MLIEGRKASVIIFLMFMLAGAALFLLPAKHVDAQFASPVEFDGYAWSSNIGWISMNCSNEGSCATSNYKVQLNPDFTITGFAWSSNIGWIQFGGLGAPPAADLDGDSTVRLDIATNRVSGWAKALSHGDGWDGWISLDCNNTGGCATSAYGVTAGIDRLDDFGWGDDVVGWVNFSQVRFPPPCAPSIMCLADLSGSQSINQWCEVTTLMCEPGYICSADDAYACILQLPTGSVSVQPDFIRNGGTTQIDWNADDQWGCSVEQFGAPLMTYPSTTDSGTLTSDPIFNETQIVLTCEDVLGGEHIVDTATVRVTHTVEEN